MWLAIVSPPSPLTHTHTHTHATYHTHIYDVDISYIDRSLNALLTPVIINKITISITLTYFLNHS